MLTETFLKFILSKGIRVFPAFPMTSSGMCKCGNSECASPGKHPFIKKSWKKIASSDWSVVERWWKAGLNLAACTGSSIVVVDVDAKEHSILEELNRTETLSYQTGGGGYHFWFSSDAKIKNSVSFIAQKVDVRGEGGYVIIPPSNHYSGDSYKFLTDDPDLSIQGLPDWILDRICGFDSSNGDGEEGTAKPKKKAKSATHEAWRKGKASVQDIRTRVQEGVKIPLGARNDSMHRLLSSDRAKGIIVSWNDMLGRIDEYQEWLVEPLAEKEAENIGKSVMNYPLYNTDHEKYNHNYVTFLEKRLISVPDNWEQQLQEYDRKFFTGLAAELLEERRNNPSFIGLSMATIQTRRNEWYESQIIEKFSKILPKLMGAVLRSFGFEHFHNEKGNYWRVPLPVNNTTNVLPSVEKEAEDSMGIKSIFTNISTEFYVPKGTEVVWVDDLFVHDWTGGAELTSQALIEDGQNVFRMHSAHLTKKIIKDNKHLVWVFGNTSQMPYPLMDKLKGITYYSLEYDLRFCTSRSLELHKINHKAPCNCLEKEYGKTIVRFLQGAKNVFWMAERQKQVYEQHCGIENIGTVLNSVLSRDSLRILDLLRIGRKPIANQWAVYGSSSWIKGTEEALAWCKLNNKTPKILEKMAPQQFLQELAKCEGLVFLPKDSDTCPRLVLEAKMLGLNLVLNEHVLHAKESWFDSDQFESHLRNRSKAFWDVVNSKPTV